MPKEDRLDLLSAQLVPCCFGLWRRLGFQRQGSRHCRYQKLPKLSVSDALNRYIVSLVQQTRSHPQLKLGASPRASRSLYQGGKTWAAMQGRNYVIPEDIQTIWLPVMNHRVTLTTQARLQKKTPETVLSDILDATAVPPYQKELFGSHA